MKKLFKYIALIPLMAVMGTSCDILDINRPGYFAEDAIYENEDAFEKYATGFYALIRSQSQINNSHYYDAYAEIMKQTGWYLRGSQNQTLLTSNYLTTNSNGSLGAWDYSRITRQNEFLMNAPVRAAHFGEEFLKVRMPRYGSSGLTTISPWPAYTAEWCCAPKKADSTPWMRATNPVHRKKRLTIS